MARRTLETVLVGIGVALATAIVFAPLLARMTHAIPLELRDPILNAWILAWDADHLRHGMTGWWNMPIFYPLTSTLAFSEHLLGIAIFAAPIEWASGNPILAYNVVFLASFVFAGVGMFLLARDVTGRSDAAAVAAAIFAFHPERIAQAGHIQLLVTGWMPLSLLGFRRYFATGSRVALAGGSAAYLLEAMSDGYLLFYFGFAVAAAVLWGLWQTPRARLMSVGRDLAVAAVLVLAAYAPIARGYLHVRSTYGLMRSDDDIRNFSADLGSYLAIPPAVRAHLHLSLPSYPKPAGPEEAHDGVLFPGITMLVLGAIGLWSGRSRDTILFGSIAGIGLVLSLGPEPAAWGHRLMSSGPYDWLLAVVPGLDGLRVPARLAVLVYLGLTVLAAFGAAAVASRLSRRWRPVLCVALASFAVFEAYGAVPLAEVGRRGRTHDNGLYSWLAQQPPGAVVELPIGALDRSYRGFLYEYNTRVHGHPIVDGFTGYMADLSQFLGDPGSPFQATDSAAGALDMMRGLGVRYVIVHPSDFTSEQDGQALVSRLRAARDGWTDTLQFGDAHVFVVSPGASSCGPSTPDGMELVPPGELHATASGEPALVGRLFDGDLTSVWSTRAPQVGGESVTLSADAPREFGLVRMRLNPDVLRDYPRGLVVEARVGDAWQPVFQGSAIEAFGRGFLTDPRYPSIDLPLDPISTRTLRIRQTGRTSGPGWWSIAELQLYARKPA